MAALTISLGQHSDKGRKPRNQDFYGAYLPSEPLRATKGIAIALADGFMPKPGRASIAITWIVAMCVP